MSVAPLIARVTSSKLLPPFDGTFCLFPRNFGELWKLGLISSAEFRHRRQQCRSSAGPRRISAARAHCSTVPAVCRTAAPRSTTRCKCCVCISAPMTNVYPVKPGNRPCVCLSIEFFFKKYLSRAENQQIRNLKKKLKIDQACTHTWWYTYYTPLLGSRSDV